MNAHSHPFVAGDQVTCCQLLEESLQALRAGDANLALARAEHAARESERDGCGDCRQWVALQLGYVHVQREEYAQAASSLAHLHQLARTGRDETLASGTELSHQLCSVLDQGMSTARWLHEISTQFQARLAVVDASLREVLARLMEHQMTSLHLAMDTTTSHGAVHAPQYPGASAPSSVRIDFDVQCLGMFAISHDGRRVTFPRNRKVEGVLKYLVMHHHRPVSRDVLMRLGWPGANREAAANDLNTTVSVLRSSLNKVLERAVQGSPILFQDDHYRLNPELSIRIDVAEFDAHCSRGRDHERRGWTHKAMADYQAAVSIYRGDLLMGDLYDDWTIIERERLASTFLTVLGKLGTYCMVQKQYEDAIAHAHRLLEHDPCSEDAHCLLMRCFVRLGQRAQALRQYELCRTILQRELQIEPAPETAELRQRIASGESV